MSSVGLAYMTVATSLLHLHHRRDLNILGHVSAVLGQARGLQPVQLHTYVFIHEVGTLSIHVCKPARV